MPDLGTLLLVPLVFAPSVIGPGLWIVRRTDWRPGEKATATIVLSLILVGHASFVIGVLRLHPFLRALLFVVCAALTLAGARPAMEALRHASVRKGLLALFFLTAWVVALQALIHSYSGGNIYADWLEQYQRSKFFQGGQPPDARFIADLLPSRPPLVNAFMAQIMALTRSRFPCFQLAMALLGALTFLPVLQVARLFSGRPSTPFLIVAFLMFNPMFVQNATYTWTKLQAALFVLAAVAFYVAGCRRDDPRRIIFSFICAAGAILTHYTTFACALFLGLHYVLRVLPRRPRPFRELAATVLASYLILAPWFAWSVSVYGARAVVQTAVASSGTPAPSRAEQASRTLLNLRDTLVPPLVREVPWDTRSRGLAWGHLRDVAVTHYQRNLPLAFGCAGVFLLAAEALRSRRARGRRGREGIGFWVGLAAFNVIVGIMAYNARDPLGVAFSAQQPLVLMGLAYLAARFEEWPRWLRGVALLGFLIDALLGVLIPFWMQTFVPQQPSDWRGPLRLTQDDLLIGSADWNWILKRDANISFVSDVTGLPGWLPALVVAALLVAALAGLARAVTRPAAAAPAH